jgi:sulfur-carrier protein
MARVVLVGNLAQLTGGVAEFVLSATSVKQLFQQLVELHPALGRHLDDGIAVAIDGQIFQDALFEPIGPDSEVFLLPQIAGGTGGLIRRAGASGSRRPAVPGGARGWSST